MLNIKTFKILVNIEKNKNNYVLHKKFLLPIISKKIMR